MIISVDPQGYHVPKGATKGRIVEACGIIPMFAAEAYLEGHTTASDVYNDMVDTYGFGDWSSVNWGKVSPDGTLKSAIGDPDLVPLLELQFPSNPVKVFIYQHAILAVVGPDETIVSRMD